MSKPEISIITIVYNGLPFLKECVESVLAQDFQDWELLISDDGSTDGSRDYIASLKDPRIRYFFQPKNLGIFGNLNFLFSKAETDLCQILCQDDYFTSSSSLSELKLFWSKADKDLGIVRFNHSSLQSKQLFAYQKEILPSVINAGEADVWFYVFGNIMGNLSNVSLRTAVINKCGEFSTDLPYAGDFEFWARAARQVKIGVQAKEIVHVRRHPGVASNYLNKKGELFFQKKIIIEQLYEHVRRKVKCPDFSLKLHGTLQYDSLGRDTAIKFRFKGNSVFYNAFASASKNCRYTFGGLGKWLVFLISAGGRYGRVSSARKIIRYVV